MFRMFLFGLKNKVEPAKPVPKFFANIDPDLILTALPKRRAMIPKPSFLRYIFDRLIWVSLGFIMGVALIGTFMISLVKTEPNTVREFYSKERENFNDSKTFRYGDSTFYGLGFRELHSEPQANSAKPPPDS